MTIFLRFCLKGSESKFARGTSSIMLNIGTSNVQANKVYLLQALEVIKFIAAFV